MTSLNVIRVLSACGIGAEFDGVAGRPGRQNHDSTRMETLFIRLDVNGDGRLDASEVQGRRALSPHA